MDSYILLTYLEYKYSVDSKAVGTIGRYSKIIDVPRYLEKLQ